MELSYEILKFTPWCSFIGRDANPDSRLHVTNEFQTYKDKEFLVTEKNKKIWSSDLLPAVNLQIYCKQ